MSKLKMSYEEFMQSAPGKSAGIFFGDSDRYKKSMDWLYKTFEGWPGDFSINFEYDAIKILIAASMYNACSGRSGRHPRQLFDKYLKAENSGVPQAMADAACNFCCVEPIDYLTMEDYLITRFNNIVSHIDFKLTSSDWIGNYGFGGLKVLYLMEGREPLRNRYDRYYYIARECSILHDTEISGCVQFVTIADDASNKSIFEALDEHDKKAVLLCARTLTRRIFNAGLARSIGSDIIRRIVCGNEDSITDKWMEVTARHSSMSMDDLKGFIDMY